MENTNYPLQEKIQSYATGQLDDAERRALASQAAQDPEAAEELIFGQNLVHALKRPDLIEANIILQDIIDQEGFPPPESPASPPSSPRSPWLKWLIGTVLVASLGVGGYYMAERQGWLLTEAERLSEATLEPLEDVLFLPTDGVGIADLQRGMAAYDAGQYGDAAKALSVYVSQRPDQAAQVYLGISLIKSGQSAAAITPLADAAQVVAPPVTDAAQWYLALAYLRQNQVPAARQVLELIPKDGLFGEPAQKLIQQLPQ